MAAQRDDTPSLAFAVACLVACRLLAMRTLPFYDDAFITFRYARNLAAGHGFVYQLGERVLGTTTPLFGLLCALPFALHLPMPATVRGLNLACDAATLVLTWRMLREAAPPLARWLFAALFAAVPILGRVCAGGMEVNLFLLTGIVAIGLDQRGRRAGTALAAVAYFLRPEALLLLLVLLVRTWRRAGPRKALAAGALAAVVIGLPLLAIHAYYGAALSQSVMAKWHTIRPSTLTVLRGVLAPDAFLPALLPFAAWGVVRTMRRAGPLRVLALWLGLGILAYAVARPKIWSWYVEAIAYAVVVLAACGATELIARARRAAPVVARLAPAAPALAVLLWVAVARMAGPSAVTRNVFVPLADWCRAHARPTTTFMADDVGALGYDSDARIYDQAGLVWPPGPTMTAEELARRYRPAYVFVNVTREGLRFRSLPVVAARYRPVARFSKAGETSLEPDSTGRPTGWVQDYLMLERIDPAP